nr:MFS transporter [Pseudomonas corrugata]
MLGTLTVSLNNSSLNPALPAFMAAFAIGPLMATWIVAGFMTAMGMTMPLTSFLSQRLGRKRLYLWGVALFIGGSLMGAVADSIVLVIAARVVQGIASGLMIPLSLAIIFSVYAKDERGRVTGLWSAVVMLAPAVGPLCGSLLLEWFSWRSLFLMNVPIGLVASVTTMASRAIRLGRESTRDVRLVGILIGLLQQLWCRDVMPPHVCGLSRSGKEV